MATYRVRAGRPEDGERVSAMAAALSAHEGEPPPPFSAADFRRYGFGAEKRFDAVIVETGGRAVGYALFCDSFHVGLGTPGLHMIDLFVERDHRRAGAGRVLVGTLARICRDRGGTWLTWQCQPQNADAMGFYQRIGGRRFGAANFELSGRAFEAAADQAGQPV